MRPADASSTSIPLLYCDRLSKRALCKSCNTVGIQNTYIGICTVHFVTVANKHLSVHLSCREIYSTSSNIHSTFNPLTPNDSYRGRTAPLTSKCYILYIYSTNIDTEYFKHGIYSPFLSLQNAVCFIIVTYFLRAVP